MVDSDREKIYYLYFERMYSYSELMAHFKNKYTYAELKTVIMKKIKDYKGEGL